ncbi:MAG: hypothetical protein KDB03_26330 [Planctomycetales bacterium]|nr:hypothetical protein [Planctomycetales bacterium]
MQNRAIVNSIIASIIVLGGVAEPAHCDTFRLSDGRVIVGTVVRGPQKVGDDTAWIVELGPGVMTQVFASQLQGKERGHVVASEDERAAIEHAMQLTTADELYTFAGQCRSNHPHLADALYRRILDLDPEDPKARAALNYKRDPITGQWIDRDFDMVERRGKIFEGGKWKFPEIVAIEKARREDRETVGRARKEIKMWHGLIMKNSADALTKMSQIDAPEAVGPLAEQLFGLNSQEIKSPIKMELIRLYFGLLVKIGTPGAVQSILQYSLDKNAEAPLRDACYRFLVQSEVNRRIAADFYQAKLRDKDPVIVNLAADGLAQMHPGNDVLLPLISALVTTYQGTIDTGSGTNANMQSGTFGVGGGKKTITLASKNDSVLGLLTQMTNENFQYDQNAWIAWYASRYGQPAGDLRRDE